MIGRFTGKNFFLSNFSPISVAFEGIVYPSSEHAFQAAKTDDIKRREAIARLITAYEATLRGRSFPTSKDWTKEKSLEVMNIIVREKFTIPLLAAQLLATGDHELVQINDWHDIFWGVSDGRGENHLGRILMDVRKEIKAAC